jgi:PST family polysaccharide transporter
MMLFNSVNYAHRQGDNLIVGRELGAAALGLYSRGYNLFMLPLMMIAWPIASVVMPLMSRQQDDPPRFATTYASALASVYLLTAPVAGGLFLFSQEAITVLYGAKWVESAAVLQILAIAILWQPAYTSGGWIDLSLGRSKRQFQASLACAGVYLTCYLIGVRYGIVGMAKGYLCSNLIIIVPWLWWTSRGTLITFGLILRSVRGSIFALAGALLVTWLATPHLPGEGLLNFVLRCTLYGATYSLVTLICWKVDRGWSTLIMSAISKLKSNA